MHGAYTFPPPPAVYYVLTEIMFNLHRDVEENVWTSEKQVRETGENYIMYSFIHFFFSSPYLLDEIR
jgi:hypothetical protein